ncbi:MAG: cytochrome c [Pyrinomonadaceae bacterium]
MKSIKLAVIVAIVTLLAVACDKAETSDKTSATPPAQQSANVASTDELSQARTIYGERCTRCHGANAEGGLVEFDNIRLKVPSLREGRARNHTDERLARQIANGGEGMRAFKDILTEEQINALVRLIRQDFQK